MSRKALRLALAAAVLAAVLNGLAGWALASGLRRDALRVRSMPRRFGVTVGALGEGRIVLLSRERRTDVVHPGTLGLYWDSGYGQVGEMLEQVPGGAVRRFRLLEGSPPPLGSEVDIEGYAFPGGPESVGLGFSEEAYPGPLGPLPAWLVPGGSPWVIHVHGWTAERREAVRSLRQIHEAGWTSFVIGYRNDPDAPRDPSGHHRFGLSEWEDVEASVRHALGSGATAIVLFGYSTGAAHIMKFLERSDLRTHVIGLIFDSPNLHLAETIRHGLAGLTIPGTPVRLNRVMTSIGLWLADWRWGVDWHGTNHLLAAGDAIDVPTLVFHGAEDPVVPLSTSKALRRTAPDLVRLVEVEGAGHVGSWNVDPAGYGSELTRFLEPLQN